MTIVCINAKGFVRFQARITSSDDEDRRIYYCERHTAKPVEHSNLTEDQAQDCYNLARSYRQLERRYMACGMARSGSDRNYVNTVTCVKKAK